MHIDCRTMHYISVCSPDIKSTSKLQEDLILIHDAFLLYGIVSSIILSISTIYLKSQLERFA